MEREGVVVMNEMSFKVIKHEKIKLLNPVLIEALPGIANVARIAGDYIIDTLKAKKIITIYSNTFPNSVFINKFSLIELPKMEVYQWRDEKNKRDLLILVGDAQPVKEKDSYFISKKIIELAKELRVKQVITMGGIGLKVIPEKNVVHGAATEESLVKKLESLGAVCDGNKTVGLIFGAAGLLMAYAKFEKIPSVSLLAETFAHPQHLGFKASKNILEILCDYLDFELDFTKLNKEIAKIKKREKAIIDEDLKKTMEFQNLFKKDTRYIG